jgi:hypothetical protein
VTDETRERDTDELRPPDQDTVAEDAAPEPVETVAIDAATGPQADGTSDAEQPADAEQPTEASSPAAESPKDPAGDGTSDDTARPGAEAAFAIERAPVARWPFFVYDGVWFLLAAAIVWLLAEVPEGMAVYESPIYPATIYAGVALTALGPVLVVAVWLFSRSRAHGTNEPIFVTALMRGAIATLIGVSMWWASLTIVDYVRLGGVF